MTHIGGGQLDLLSGYDNVLVVNDLGETLYYDIADLSILVKLGHRPEDFIGRNILSFYTNLDATNSTVMTVLRTGQAMTNIEQRLITKTGSAYTCKSSTYPIEDGGKVIGAIEFSTHYFDKDDLEHVEAYAGHPIYRKNGTQYTIDDVIATSPIMTALKERLPRLAKSDTSILLYGKTGTGKNVIAQSIHNLSNRFAKPFVALDCGGLAGEAVDRVLFGIESQDVTGSVSIPGIFEKAHGGTLFLDEVNVLPQEMQARLLKAIGDKRIRRVGGTEEIPVNLRIISAMNEDPEELIRNQQLREDFYYRLAVLQVKLPELKDRREDIQPFVDYFIHFYNKRMDMHVLDVEIGLKERFMTYEWPGNIRELRNVIEAAFHHVSGAMITAEDVPLIGNRHTELSETSEQSMRTGNLRDAIDEFERSLIENEYKKASGVLAETARQLGVSKQSLKYKLDKYGLRI
ncbi:sigma-54 interaction domain-containing protein [Sporosarcina gallistercoris]|uniref:Sigma 54-interacting transcriptional regulator n=1 Tax=Sporosarcina gallistercoris TaxID=2762245 RepID=A0ABR8PKS8_9BACL|nr:sigma 54-interacting transcriptional regulator [Sporosarcina gallistercoris]MBD7908766.1 sigma 54-interacting transcriptional regulator [Sporosarcina gallistercoris]